MLTGAGVEVDVIPAQPKRFPATHPENQGAGQPRKRAGIVALGGRMQSLSDALAMVTVFLETPFSNDPRHVRRLQLLDDYENQHCC